MGLKRTHSPTDQIRPLADTKASGRSYVGSLSENAAGVSLLELALVLPVILILIAGLVDFGFKINSVKVVSSAARHSARVAAGHSRPLSAGILCGPPIASAVCPADSAIAIDPTPANPVTAVAVRAACNYLSSSRLDAQDYNVSAEVVLTQEGNTRPFQSVTVTVQHSDADSGCLFCYERASQFFVNQSTSRFILEGGCL